MQHSLDAGVALAKGAFAVVARELNEVTVSDSGGLSLQSKFTQ